MTTTRATASPTFFRAYVLLNGYELAAYGTTEAQALTLLGKAARKWAKEGCFTLQRDWAEYFGVNISEISLGHAFVEGSDSVFI